MTKNSVIKVRNVAVELKGIRVLKDVTLDVYRGEILGFVGASGAGKSVLTRTILGLLPKQQGRIEVFDVDLDEADETQRQQIERRWGTLFQQGALFSSLTVGENVEFPIREYLNLSDRLVTEIAITKLEMVGLKADVYRKYPSELSGGMVKRVALARALALDPEILFLDEPTSGLDPISAADFDQLILTLQQTSPMAVFMVTHDLDSLHTICNRIAVLGDGKIIEAGTMDKMLASQHPWLRAYFRGVRARPALRLQVGTTGVG
ncbi:MAG TPA: ABC transporter ATP-binding protein [Bradyrhizobium sp.]|uniref:ABC transporter ATP-binding protein n=1 Tax=Bradyrhizobium sp. TaxID=376 RepID=UPI002B4AAB5B|nr:ABC transporter ATP-binding protein [Bradyrhizobium sp.]HKO70413.1 ABC transporter ATP-binding protein [Bradyrhizobium sp.]